MTIRYLSRGEIAELLGISLDTLKGYDKRQLLPEPDALVGRNQGWLETTIVEWNKNRPGRGARTDLT
ncbi:XRE family transcriptional regulator [Rhodococcoides fascians]|uniref:helix-turn-helix transcriptional regulator n=1 Tax=Rhodococcoides fascians TaxID=1828 RepID=UPI002ACEE6AF|nr:XRE family transcriptional regulator [Rhodococcus fascians]WQH26818.1 XRE family transcriptional regulator [Rhodococcus fascians]